MRKIAAVLLAIAVIVGIWWYASPLWTLHQMREAATRGDADALSGYVDYPAVREDLKGEFRRAMFAEMQANQDNGFAAIGSAFALALIDPMIEAIVTPEGVEGMFDRKKRAEVPNGRAQLPDAASDPIIDRDGFDHFIVRDSDPAKGSMVFKRSGIGWRLSGFDMPPNALSKPDKTAVPRG